MTCQEVLERIAQREGEGPLPEEVRSHLAACAACARGAEPLLKLDAFARAQLTPPPIATPRPSRAFRWQALAASAILVAGAGVLLNSRPGSQAAPSAPSVPALQAGASGSIERAPGAVVRLVDGRLLLEAGACWVEAREALELAGPLAARILPGTEAELALEPTAPSTAWSWMREAAAAETSVLRVCVAAGRIEFPGLPGAPALTAGSLGRVAGGGLKSGPLTAEHRARIETWRAEALAAAASGPGKAGRLEGGASPHLLEIPTPASGAVLSARVRGVTGNLVLRYPLPGGAGETTLGDLPALRDPAWHRLVLKSGGSGVEIFLDGRRILKVPALPDPALPSGTAALGVRGGAAEVSDLAAGPRP